LQGGAIGGTASIIFNGSRTVIVANSNSYSGGSTINAGTVQLGDGTNPVGTLGSGSIVNNAALTLAYSANNGTLPNDISGTGSLNVTGSGTITVSGSNTYSGSTSIPSAGTVVLPAGGMLGTGAMTNSGTIITTGSTTLANNTTG